MATSGYVDKKIKDWLTLRLLWSVTSQSVANNSSVVNVKAQLITSGGNINSSASKDISLVINGTVYSDTCTVGIAKNTTRTLMTKSVTITHGADGKKTFSMTCVLDLNVTLSLSWVGKVSVGGSGTLPDIDRVSTFTWTRSSDYLGQPQKITITRADSSFTHKISYELHGRSVLRGEIATGVGTSYTWTPPVSMAQNMPAYTDRFSCYITVETYSGGMLIGTIKSGKALYLPPDVVPTITDFSLTEYVPGIAEQYGAFLNTKSQIKYSVKASGEYNATISKYSVSLAGQTFSGTTGTTAVINTGSGTKTATVTVTDSRGRSTSKTISYTVLAYQPPTFYNAAVHRCNADGTLNEQGEAFILQMSYRMTSASGPLQNRCEVSYKPMDSGSYVSLPFDSTADVYAGTPVFSEPVFSTNNTYYIRVQLTDFFGTVPRVLVLSSSRPVFDVMYNGAGFAFNKMAEVPDLLDIGYKTRFYGGIQPVYIQDATDLNDMILPGYYASRDATSAGLANAPTPTGTFTLEVLGAGTSGQVMQRITVCNKTAPSTFVRHFYGGSWGAWVQIF